MSSISPSHLVNTPDELIALGMELIPPPSLLGDPRYGQARQQLSAWVARIPALAKRPPREYQAKYVALSSLRQHNFWAWDMGTGKTFGAICLILLHYGPHLDTLGPGTIHIMAPPPALRGTWKDEFEFAGLGQYVELITSEEQLYTSTKPIWLYDYDFTTLQTKHGLAEKRLGRGWRQPNGGKRFFWGKRMAHRIAKRFPPSLLIADEVHRLRAGTDRTKCCTQVRKKAKRVLVMTGTPMDGWVEHLATILRFCYGVHNPAFPYTEEAFAKRFTRTKQTTLDWATGEEGEVVRSRRIPGINPTQLSQFYADVGRLMHRLMITDPEVAGEVKYPPVFYHDHVVDMESEHFDYYDRSYRATAGLILETLEQLEAGQLSEFRAEQTALQQIKTLRFVSSAPWTEPDCPDTLRVTAKMRAVLDLGLQAKAAGRKFIVFVNLISTGKALTDYLNAHGVKSVRVYASDEAETPKTLVIDKRLDRVQQWQDDDDTWGMVANLELLAESLTLIEGSIIIHHDEPWRGQLEAQGERRVVRPGGREAGVDIYYLQHAKTVDKYIRMHVASKRRANDTAIDRSGRPGEESYAKLSALAIGRQMIGGGTPAHNVLTDPTALDSDNVRVV